MMILMFALSAQVRAGGEASVDLLAGGRTAPYLTSAGPSELIEGEVPVGLLALRGALESGAVNSAWVGLGVEGWGYGPASEQSMLRAEPRAGWTADLGARWRLAAGALTAMELFPWEEDLTNGRSEASLSAGMALGTTELSLIGGAVRRDYFARPEWSFQAGEAGVALVSLPGDGGLRLGGQLGAQINSGYTLSVDGARRPATGTQGRARLELGWTGRRVDLGASWRLILAGEGQVEDSDRPQFTPIGQYADDADALSAGGFVQNRLDVSGAWAPSDAWLIGLDGLARLRRSDAGQASASWRWTGHVQAHLERQLTERVWLISAAGVTSATLVTGTSATDYFGWLGIRLKPSE